VSPALAAVASVLVVSAVPLAVGWFLPTDEAALRRVVRWLVCSAIGALLGAAFLHLIPEALAEPGGARTASAVALGGFLTFFLLERYLWSHHHDPTDAGRMNVPPLAALNLMGDGAHNFVDGMAIAAAYTTDPSLGLATTVAVLLHELPQEIGDYGILLHAGLERRRAMSWNFVSGLIAVVGTAVVLLTRGHVDGFAAALIPFSAGGFIYIAAADLIPQLREETGPVQGGAPLLAIPLGIVLSALPLLLHIG
jgi:zinc and cadmium transporter